MLRYKINGAILIAFVIIALVFTLIQRPLQQRRMQTVMGKVKSVLHTLVDRDSAPLANAIVDHRIRDIQQRVQQMLEVEGIMAVSVFNRAGSVLYSAGDAPQERDLSPDEQERTAGGVHIGQERNRGDSGDKRFEHLQELQVIGERYGFIQMSYSLADIEAERRQSQLISGGLLGSILVLMLVVLNLLLSKIIIQPIGSLRDAMHHIRDGDLGRQIQGATQDEIGELASTFNAMSWQLRQNQLEYSRLNRLVEEQAEAQRRHELAEAANQAKSDFLRTISHEIRTPLNVIIGFSELARQTPYAETQQIYVERIAASGKILNALVNGVLDLAGIEAGKFSLNPDDFDLHSVLHTAAKPFQYGAADEDVSWDISIDENVPSHVFGDSTRLTQVLVNLISNAVKFTQHGTISLMVELEESRPDFAESFAVPEDSLWLHFSVHDTGIGIPEEEQASIFKQFFQGKEAKNHVPGGTGGIGMTIVKKIVETMHGNIRLTSKSGIGTHIHVVLPFGRKTNTETHERRTAVSLGALRILVAEDNSSNRLMLQAWLSHLGFQVETVENGARAIERWQQAVFDVILMDKQMPEMDGLQATQNIRVLESQKGGHTHIIALTAAATTDDRAQCLEAGMDDYLPKPVDISALLHKLNTCFPDKGVVSEENAEEAVSLSHNETHESLCCFTNMPESWKNDSTKKEKYIALMLEDIRESLHRLDLAIRDEDRSALSKAAHKLKGAVGKIRSKTVQGLVLQLETMRRQEDLKEASALLARLKEELGSVLGMTGRD